MFDILDEQGDPSGAEAREIPPRFSGFICLDQKMPGQASFELQSCEYFISVEELWDACTKKLWPTNVS